MGVHGLWPVLEPAGHPVTVESLEGKRLAIDVSIWLHQAMKGAGAHQLNARNPHLALLLNRLAKLLFYRIRPVFVFDGTNIPIFKKRILAERRVKRDLDTLQLTKAQKKVLEEAALASAAGKPSDDNDVSVDRIGSASQDPDDLFQLPSTSKSDASMADQMTASDSDDDDDAAGIPSDVDAEVFDRVPAELRMEMLLDAQERAKDARVRPENLPSNAVRFSRFQLDRLLKRKKVTEQLDQVKRQIVGTFSDGRSGNVKMAVFQGRSRGHVVQVDDEDEEDSDIQILDTAWPVLAARASHEMRIRAADVDLKLAKAEDVDVDSTKAADVDLHLAKATDDKLEQEKAENGDLQLAKAAEVDFQLAKAENVDFDSEKTTDVDLQLAIEASLRPHSNPSPSNGAPDKDPQPTLIRPPPTLVYSSSPSPQPSSPLRDAASSSNTVKKRPDIIDLTADGWSSNDDCDFVDVSDPEDVSGLLPDNLAQAASRNTPSPKVIQKPVTREEKDVAPVASVEAEPVDDDYYRKELPPNPSAGESLSEAIYLDCQQLLRLCGIPYVVAPSEAEAQCAHLEQLKLVNGTVSDDSDVWLFGASTVYRHMFDRRKHIQCFSQAAIQRSLGLTRMQMIQVAMLSGADYTTGFEGVGVVTALELIAEFASELKGTELDDGMAVLQAIADWRSRPPPCAESSIRRRLRKVLSNGRPPNNFPDPLVYDAYVRPNVDESTESFAWGRPDVTGLKLFVWDKLGWPEEKLDSVMKSAFVKWNEYLNGAPLQTRITSFAVKLHKKPEDMKLASTRRVETALKRMQKAEPTADLSSEPNTKRSSSKEPVASSKSQKKPVKKRPKRKATAKSAKVFQISESSSSESE
uniref:Uncharacterized protein n=1 Tax=Plectus sambesii TaxID=2011161 RepID=A0A914WU46_9BILA